MNLEMMMICTLFVPCVSVYSQHVSGTRNTRSREVAGHRKEDTVPLSK